jgi:hypothetical protein
MSSASAHLINSLLSTSIFLGVTSTHLRRLHSCARRHRERFAPPKTRARSKASSFCQVFLWLFKVASTLCRFSLSCSTTRASLIHSSAFFTSRTTSQRSGMGIISVELLASPHHGQGTRILTATCAHWRQQTWRQVRKMTGSSSNAQHSRHSSVLRTEASILFLRFLRKQKRCDESTLS